MKRFLTICFINNYNNERFLAECLNSVFSQTVPFDKVIVVDDGSTDSSLEVLISFQTRHKNLEIHKKTNGGQISTFNFIVDLIPLNAQIFLLDGDDIYPSDYLETVLDEFQYQSWDFAFCGHQKFQYINDRCLNTSRISSSKSIFFLKSSALTRSRFCWIGNITSTLSLSGEVFKKIFPYPINKGQVLWTDNIMIYAASILGFKKTYLKSIAIGWRVHEGNDSKKIQTAQYLKQKQEDIENVFLYFCEKAKVSRYPSISEFYSDFRTLGKEGKKYLKLPNHWKLINRIVRNRFSNPERRISK